MFRVLTCLTRDHDPAMLIGAGLICIIGSLVAFAVVQRGLLTGGKARFAHLIAAGLLTGVTIWGTHFAGMMAYASGPEIRFNATTTIFSLFSACVLSIFAWITASAPGKLRGWEGC